PDKHRLGSAKLALIYVNAQDLPPSFTLFNKKTATGPNCPHRCLKKKRLLRLELVDTIAGRP
ncbi:hypothetical protein, partial [Levilactobacillus parabrevis]